MGKEKNNEKEVSTRNLLNELTCALTHDLFVCQNCKKCGENVAVIRMRLINDLTKLINQEKLWEDNK